MFNRIKCALGYHQWGGWTSYSDGLYRGKLWCLVCKVAWGEPADWNKDN